MNNHPTYSPKMHFWRNRVLLFGAVFLAGWPLALLRRIRITRYRPKSKLFILAANHGEDLDPVYEMLALGHYLRFVSSDHVVRDGLKGWLVNFFATPIVKSRDHPRGELTRDILATLRAGVSVGIHVEGGTSFNGESRYISPNTAKLVKEAGCALITYRTYGGYLRTPRWKKYARKGPLIGGVVREYSAEELRAMSEEEVYALLHDDLYVNAYTRQREVPERYAGRALAENCEIILYRCPVCGKIGTLRSEGDELYCTCGYHLQMRDDGFFHDCGQGVVFDNICDWEHWQRETLPAYLDALQDRPDEPIFRDEEQRLVRIANDRPEHLSDHAALALYRDRIELRWEGGERSIPMAALRSVDYVSRQSLLLVTAEEYFELGSKTPRSPTKYTDAWRALTGRPNY